MLNMAHPEDAHLMSELMQSLGPLNKPIIMRWIGKDKVIRWMESRLVTVYDKSKQLVAVEGLTRDITERKRSIAENRKLISKSHKRGGGCAIYHQARSTWIHIHFHQREHPSNDWSEEAILNQLAFNKLMTDLLTRFAICTGNEVDIAIQLGLQKITEFIDGDHATVSYVAKKTQILGAFFTSGMLPMSNP